jgi:tetratricopeptide (TPR) repeat protein
MVYKFVYLLLITILPVLVSAQESNKEGLEQVKTKMATGDHVGAIEDLKKHIAVNQKNEEAYFLIASAYYMIGNNKESMLNFNKCIELNPKNFMAYKERGKLKAYMKDYYGSISDFTVARDINPDFSDAYFNRATSYTELKNYKKAIEDYSMVIKLNPKDADAYHRRGNVKYNSGDKEGGCVDWSKAGELGKFEVYESIKKFCNN